MKTSKYILTALVLAIGSIMPVVSMATDKIHTAEVTADFDDVRIDIENAITNRGFVVDFHANVSEMLDRTAADVGSSVSVYRHAEFWQFCSSILSRKMVEANPVNVAYCPYVIFAYETIEQPGTVVIGFRPIDVEDDSSKAILGEINNQLIAIVKEAVE